LARQLQEIAAFSHILNSTALGGLIMGIISNLKEYFWVSGDGEKPATTKPTAATKTEPKRVTSIRGGRNGYSDVSEIVTLDPATYEDSKLIAEHFCQDIPLIINMANLSEKDSLRTLDFILGLKEGRQGSLKRVTPKVFLLTPANVLINQGEDEEDGADLVG
jgi:cell division inhibitor SepF